MAAKNLLFLLPFLVYLLLKHSCINVVPDFFGLYHVKADEYFALILSLTSSIVGVLIAVVLLMFQMNKNNFLRRKGESFLEKPMIFIIITISLSGLILGFCSYITIPQFNNGSNLSVGYFMGFLFIAFVTLIFPAIKDILDELNNLKIVKDRINQLKKEDFYSRDEIPNDYQLLDPDHPLHRIRHELIIAVRESDYEAYTGILISLNLKTAQLYGDGKDRRYTDIILKGLTYIWQESVLEASRNNTFQFFKSLWDTIGAMYAHVALIKSPLLHFQEVEHFIYEHIQFLGRNNLGDTLTSGVWALSQMFDKNLTYNRPDQERISGLYDIFEHQPPNPHDVDSSIQWDFIERFIGFIRQIQQTAIDNKDKELFNTCNFHLNHILSDISYEHYGQLGDYQEGALAVQVIGFGQMYMEEAFDREMYTSINIGYDVNINFVCYAVEKQRFYVKTAIKDISDYLIRCQRKQCLDSYTISNFGAVGRRLSKDYEINPLAKVTIKFIIMTLKFLKEDIENTQLPEQSYNYLEIKKQLQSQKDFLIRDNPALQGGVLTEIQDLIDEFREVIDKQKSEFVSWPE